MHFCSYVFNYKAKQKKEFFLHKLQTRYLKIRSQDKFCTCNITNASYIVCIILCFPEREKITKVIKLNSQNFSSLRIL